MTTTDILWEELEKLHFDFEGEGPLSHDEAAETWEIKKAEIQERIDDLPQQSEGYERMWKELKSLIKLRLPIECSGSVVSINADIIPELERLYKP